MLTAAISLAILTSTPIGPAPHWQQDLLASPLARNVVKMQQSRGAKTRPSAATPAGSPREPETTKTGGPRPTTGHSMWNPTLEAALQRANDACREAAALLKERRYGDAYDSLERLRHGNSDDMTDDMAVACANMTGRYAEAYALLIPMVRRQGDSSPQYWLALSFASARLGQIYPGQVEYCRDRLLLGLKEDDYQYLSEDCRMKWSSDDLPTATDPKGVAVLSCLALGIGYQERYYLETALELDPTATLAAKQLVTIYAYEKRTADVRRIASGMVKNLPAGDPRRAEFQRRLAAAK